MLDATFPLLRARHADQNLRVLRDEWAAQRDTVMSRSGSGLVLLPDRFDERLAALILDRNTDAASEAAVRVARHFGGTVDLDGMDGWLDAGARAAAGAINDTTRQLLEEDDPDDVFDALDGWRGDQAAADLADASVVFGGHEGAAAAGAAGKMWIVNSGNPRSAHAALAGATVGMGETFGNGMRWPKDMQSGAAADEVANCQCSLAFL